MKLILLLFLKTQMTSAHVAYETMGLKELLSTVITGSHYIKAQALEVKAKESMVSHAGAWANPEFSVESENKTQPDGKTNGMKYSFSQSISFPGRISARKGIARSEFEIEKLNAVTLELKIQVTVAELFYEYATDIEKAKHAEERLKRFQSLSQYMKSRTFASPRKKTESSIVSSKILVLQKELEKAKSAVAITWNKLNMHLNSGDKIYPKAFWFKTPKKISLVDLTEKSLKNSPELRMAEFESEKIKQELKLARRELWPELRLIGSMSNLSGYDPEKIYTLGVAFPLPVFNMNLSASQAQNYRAQAQKTRIEIDRLNIERSIHSAYIRFLTNEKSMMQLQVSKVNEIEKDFQESVEGFRKGLVDLVTYLEADNQHSDAINAIYDTQVEYVASMGELSLLTGEFLIPLEP